MNKILIAYATTDGQTEKIATTIASLLRDSGCGVEVFDTRHAKGQGIDHDVTACILAGSLHMRKHQRSLLEFVQDNLAELMRIPTAFFSVSATGSRTDQNSIEEANQCIDEFIEESGFRPSIAFPTGGAIKYTQYNPLLRMIMKRISAKENGPTDTTRDHELTNWDRVEANVKQFMDEFVERAHAIPKEGEHCCGKCGGKCGGGLLQIDTAHEKTGQPAA